MARLANKEELDNYVEFMYEPKNINQCDRCPANEDMENIDLMIRPCGQFHCWVAQHCKRK